VTLLVHAIGPAVSAAPATTGLRGRDLRHIVAPGPGLGLWATGWDSPPGPLGRDDAFGHHAIVAAIAEAGPCLPVRFGSWLPDDAAAIDLLTGRADAFRAQLGRVAGRSELAVTLLLKDRPVTPGRGHTVAAPSVSSVGEGVGRRFLEARRLDQAETAARRATAEALAADLVAFLGTLGVPPADVRHETCPTSEVALSLSALIPTADASGVKEAMIRLAGGFGGVRGVVSGPWPPYSFTTDLT